MQTRQELSTRREEDAVVTHRRLFKIFVQLIARQAARDSIADPRGVDFEEIDRQSPTSGDSLVDASTALSVGGGRRTDPAAGACSP